MSDQASRLLIMIAEKAVISSTNLALLVIGYETWTAFALVRRVASFGDYAADYRTVLSSGARGHLAVLLETAFGTRIILVVIRKQFCIQAIVVVLS